jgi:hypothetical protein
MPGSLGPNLVEMISPFSIGNMIVIALLAGTFLLTMLQTYLVGLSEAFPLSPDHVPF